MMINRRLACCYGSIAFYNAILHNVFLLYHVETFVSVYHIDKTSFWLGETIFLLWNSLNDPLFGWLSDKGLLSENYHGEDVVLKRLNALKVYGPLFAASFAGFWFLWTYPALQFVICLCLYDGFLTMVDLHHSALLADLAVSADVRARLNAYCSVFSGIGSLTVFLSYVVWDKDSLGTFRIFCFVISVVSLCGFYFSSKMMTTSYLGLKKHDEILESSEKSEKFFETHTNEMQEQKAALKKYIKNLAGHRNFVAFALMNLIQVFHCHFNSNFFPMFLENLLGDSISQTMCSLILGVSFIAPHINNLYFLTLCRRYGVYAVIRGLFVLKLAISVVMLLLGPSHVFLLSLYIASNRVFTEGTCKLLTLVISDLVDEDFVIHQRPQAVSALMFGTAALVSKPGQTIAPLLGTWLLAVQTGHDVFESGNDLGSIKLQLSHMDSESRDSYRLGVFQLLVYVPIVCAVLQLLAWSRFTLHGKRLKLVKRAREGIQHALV